MIAVQTMHDSLAACVLVHLAGREHSVRNADDASDDASGSTLRNLPTSFLMRLIYDNGSFMSILHTAYVAVIIAVSSTIVLAV